MRPRPDGLLELPFAVRHACHGNRLPIGEIAHDLDASRVRLPHHHDAERVAAATNVESSIDVLAHRLSNAERGRLPRRTPAKTQRDRQITHRWDAACFVRESTAGTGNERGAPREPNGRAPRCPAVDQPVALEMATHAGAE